MANDGLSSLSMVSVTLVTEFWGSVALPGDKAVENSGLVCAADEGTIADMKKNQAQIILVFIFPTSR